MNIVISEIVCSIMSKCFLLVSLSVAVLRPAECLFSGDSCFAEERPGSCRLLSRCQPLLDEIRNTGTPITPTLRRKLQALSCGFELNEPLVCCVSPYTNSNNQDTGSPVSTQPWNSNSGTRIPPRPSMTTIGPWTTPETTWTTPQNGWTTPDDRRTTPQDRWTTPDNRRTTPQDRWTTPDNRRTIPEDRWTTPDNRRTIPQDRWTTTDNRRTTSQDGWTTLDDRRTTRPSVSSNINNGPPADVQSHRNLRLLPENCGVIETDRIWGGNRTRLYEMPWMVLISYDSPRGPKLSCGGTLISERYVLTAAHCVSFLGNKLTLSGVVLGEYDVRNDPDCEREEGELHCAPSIRNATIETVIPHPGYSPQNLYDDIALLRLAQPADFSLDNMKPICLPFTRELQNEQLVGKSGIVAGWGATEDGLQSPVLLSVGLPIVSNKDCQEAYNGSPKIYARQICAGGVEDKDSCGGDSGGPLMYPGQLHSRGLRYVQHGIVSYGSKRCGLGGYPGVYTRVAHYVDWILDNMTG